MSVKGGKILSKIEKNVEELINPIVTNLGYKLYDVIYEKEAKDYYLRIFIDNENGISLEDCEKVNNAITDMLDEANYIKEQYFLEVSSPGIERVIRKEKHLKQNIGQEVQVKLFRKDQNGKKEYQGKLLDYTSENITIQTSEEKINIERKNISQIKTVYNW